MLYKEGKLYCTSLPIIREKAWCKVSVITQQIVATTGEACDIFPTVNCE